MLGLAAYPWPVRHTTPATATTYAYVNPVVALLLGWAIEGEPVTARVVLSAAVILSGVVIVTTLPERRSRRWPPRGGSVTVAPGEAEASS